MSSLKMETRGPSAASKTGGFLLVDKPKGESSFQTMRPLKKIFRGQKVGFAGTLDPAATGLLLVGIGGATRLLSYAENWPKNYTFDVCLGKTSDTYDAEGEIALHPNPQYPDKARSREIVQAFAGPQSQVPPAYSAVKINGRRACDRMRRGETVEMKARPITVYSLKLLDWRPHCWTLEVHCSKGTYVRSLAHNMGEMALCGALADNIRRTAIGPFRIEAAQSPNEIEVDHSFLPPESVLEGLPRVTLTSAGESSFKHGHPVAAPLVSSPVLGEVSSGECQVHGIQGFLGLGEWKSQQLYPKKVFV